MAWPKSENPKPKKKVRKKSKKTKREKKGWLGVRVTIRRYLSDT